MDSPLNLHDYEVAAQAILSPMVYDFIAGGSCDEVTLRANRAGFDRWTIVPRVMRGIEGASTATQLLGHDLTSPIVVGPTSLHKLVCAEGELATARAAKAAGTIYAVSTASSVSIEEIAAEAGPWWFQLYIFKDRELTSNLVARAVTAGATAIVLTVDLARFGMREADRRNNFVLPDGIILANMRKPQAAEPGGRIDPSNLLPSSGGEFESALTWADLEWLVDLAGVPVIVKGILYPGDAVLAVEHGAAGIVVSNHGGRQLDSSISSIEALPPIAEATRSRVPILVDGGFRRGTDVLKALALGANAVMLGRPILWGLAVAGETGALHVLEHLASEFECDMLLAGAAAPEELGKHYLFRGE